MHIIPLLRTPIPVSRASLFQGSNNTHYEVLRKKEYKDNWDQSDVLSGSDSLFRGPD